MSRRHKETDIQATQPHMTESAADFSQQMREVLKDLQVVVSRTIVCERSSLDDIIEDKLNYGFLTFTERIFAKAFYKYYKNFCMKNLDEFIDDSTCQAFIDAYTDDDYPEYDENDKPRGRGRPAIVQLCSKFRDTAIWPMVKMIFQKIYNKSIQKATNLVQFLVGFICALFRFVKTEEPYGKVAYFHKLIKEHFKKAMMPSIRTLQAGVQWLTDKTKTFFRCANQKLEEAKHKAWEDLEEIIYRHLVKLAPQYAM